MLFPGTRSTPGSFRRRILYAGAIASVFTALLAFGMTGSVAGPQVAAAQADGPTDTPRPRPRPRPTRTPTPKPTNTPTLQSTHTPTPRPTNTPIVIIASATPTPIQAAAPTSTPTATPTPVADTPAPTPSPTLTPRATPTNTPTLLPTSTPTPTATANTSTSARSSTGSSQPAVNQNAPTADQGPAKATFVPTLPPAVNAIVPASPPPVAQAPTEPGPEFGLGFAVLKTQMGALMGDPVGPELGNPDDCDTQQLTTTGLAYRRCSTNLVAFAAFPDGQAHWGWLPEGLLEWTGAELDPPPGAPIIRAARPGGIEGRPAAACLAAAQTPSMMCNVADNVSVLGTITSAGDTNVFHFSVPSPGLEVIADLMDLPADYDLYLADSSGVLLGQSMHEGTSPEHIDVNVDGGAYYLYVHADLGREVDPQNPYRLELGFAGPLATASPVSQGLPQEDGPLPVPSGN